MTTLTTAAVLALANACVGPSLAPIMTSLAQHESGLDPAIVHHNTNGTFDVGLAQVNSSNFGWLGLTMANALDPCRNLKAGARVLLVRYNGNPSDTVKVAYSADIAARIHRLDGNSGLAPGATHLNDEAPDLEDAPGPLETLHIGETK